MNFRKLISLVCAFAVITSVATGCGTGKENTSTSTETSTSVKAEATEATSSAAEVKWDKAKKQTITLSTIKDYYTAALNQIALDYTALHPETKVDIQVIGSNDQYTTNFTTKIVADKSTAPDIIHTNLMGAGNSVGDMMSKGWVLPLDELLDETNLYNDGQKVRDAFADPFYLNQAVTTTGKVGYLPFDLVGVGCIYNKDIFEKAGLKAPETYEDLSAVLDGLQKAGFKYPLGSTGFVTWFGSSLADWGFRSLVPSFLTLPGDALYDEKAMSGNTKVTYSPNDPTFDSTAIINQEKMLGYIYKNGIDNPIAKKIMETQQSILKYCAPGWISPDEAQTYNQFLAQKVPVFVTGSWDVGRLVSDISKLSDDKKFKWAVFKFPKFKDADPNFPGEPRGLLVAGHQLGLVNKADKDLEARAADFLKYIYSPKTAAKIYDITIKKGERVQGPSLIKGVELSDEINGYLDGFKVAGTMRFDLFNMLGATKKSDDPKGAALKYEYGNGKITYEQFIKQMGEMTKAFIEDQKKAQGYDLDPATPDKVPTK